MMVIRGTLPTNTIGTNGSANIFYLPADRCVWEQGNNTGDGYTITAAFYLVGDTEPSGSAGDVHHVVIGSPALGYIGKSGRFVEIAE